MHCIFVAFNASVKFFTGGGGGGGGGGGVCLKQNESYLFGVSVNLGVRVTYFFF
jgi:hypothetical protein